MNHFKKYFQTILSNALMNIWQNSKGAPVSRPNIIKFYNNGMDGVGIMDKKTAIYRLDRKASIAFTLTYFLISWMSHMKTIILFKLGDHILLLNFKIILAKLLIIRCSNCNRSFSTTRSRKGKYHKSSMTREIPIRMLEFQ